MYLNSILIIKHNLKSRICHKSNNILRCSRSKDLSNDFNADLRGFFQFGFRFGLESFDNALFASDFLRFFGMREDLIFNIVVKANTTLNGFILDTILEIVNAKVSSKNIGKKFRFLSTSSKLKINFDWTWISNNLNKTRLKFRLPRHKRFRTQIIK